MTKEEMIIDNVKKILSSKEAYDLSESNDFNIYDSLVEEDEIFVTGKNLFPKYIIETLSRPFILMMDLLGPHSEKRIRIIIMCEGEIKLNIMSSNSNNQSPVIKTFKDEDDWQKDLEMLAWYLLEQKPIEDARELDEEDFLF